MKTLNEYINEQLIEEGFNDWLKTLKDKAKSIKDKISSFFKLPVKYKMLKEFIFNNKNYHEMNAALKTIFNNGKQNSFKEFSRETLYNECYELIKDNTKLQEEISNLLNAVGVKLVNEDYNKDYKEHDPDAWTSQDTKDVLKVFGFAFTLFVLITAMFLGPLFAMGSSEDYRHSQEQAQIEYAQKQKSQAQKVDKEIEQKVNNTIKNLDIKLSKEDSVKLHDKLKAEYKREYESLANSHAQDELDRDLSDFVWRQHDYVVGMHIGRMMSH